MYYRIVFIYVFMDRYNVQAYNMQALRPGHTATEKRETRNEKRENYRPIKNLTDFLPPRNILTNQREVQ